jgi:hypothetical protein
MGEGDTLINAIIGGIASVVLSFIPFSPLFGGGLAAYLQGGTRNDGLKVGAYSGIVAGLPIAAIGGLFVILFGFGAVGAGGEAAGGFVIFILLVLAGLAASLAYTVILGAAGGFLGNYVKYEMD